MNKNLGYQKETSDLRPAVSCELLEQFIRNAYLRLLSVCNSAPHGLLEPSSAPHLL